MQARPWSRYSKGSSAYLRLHPEEKQTKGKKAEETEEETEEALKQKEAQKKKGRIEWRDSRCSAGAPGVPERDEESLHEENVEERRSHTAQYCLQCITKS